MMSEILVRYGAIPEVSRFRGEEVGAASRGACVVVQTHRGLQLGTVLSEVRSQAPVPSRDPRLHDENPADAQDELPPIVRRASEADQETDQRLREDARAEFAAWQQRIQGWELELELIDLEWTIDRQKLVLYVLNDRGPDCTKLALQVAAAGLGIVEVQPVTADGLVTVPSASGGGCGTCGCH